MAKRGLAPEALEAALREEATLGRLRRLYGPELLSRELRLKRLDA